MPEPAETAAMRPERRGARRVGSGRWGVAAVACARAAMAIALGGTLVVGGGSAAASSDSSAAVGEWGRYRWQQALLDPPEERTLFRIAIPPEVFDGSAWPLRDLRILGASGRPWPHYLWTPGEVPANTTATGTILNRYTIDGNPQRRVAEVDAGAGRGPHSRVRVETPGRDFVRRVEVFGSRDRNEWARLGEGWLVDHAAPPHVRNDVVRFPDSDFRYLKVVVWPNARDDRDAPEVSRVTVFRTLHEDAGEWREVALAETPLPADERPEDDAALRLFDTGARNLPLRRLSLAVADAEFARPVRIWGRNDPDEEWTFVAGGEIHRHGGEESLSIELGTFHARFVKVELFHYDDDPLTVTGAVGHERVSYVVAESRDDAPAYLVYGTAPPAEEPRFDLRERTGVAAAAAAPLVRLGPREPNRRHRDLPGEWMPWIAGGVIALVSLIVVWVIAGMVRRAGAEAE